MPTTDLDACLRLVADRRRRSLIEQLRNTTDGRATIDELTDKLDREGHAPGTDRPPDRAALGVQVHHTHIPKLSAFGVVDYDERGILHYRPDEQLEAVLDALRDRDVQQRP